MACVRVDVCVHEYSGFTRAGRLHVQECMSSLGCGFAQFPVPSTKSFPALPKGASVSAWTSGPLGLCTCHGGEHPSTRRWCCWDGAARRASSGGPTQHGGSVGCQAYSPNWEIDATTSGTPGHQHSSRSACFPGSSAQAESRQGVSLGQKRWAMWQPLVPWPLGPVHWFSIMNQPGWAFQRL